jgi:2-(1,2-epoxy-1,2-dihydrophenyl)acetyl-CoA isomerase
MNFETLLLERDGGVARVTMNRPAAKNALSPQMTDELAALFGQLKRDPDVRAVLLDGAGGNFCSGGDVKGMGQGGPRNVEQRRAGMQRYRDLATALMAIDKPVVAALDGVAYGAGFSMALMADIVLVSDRVRLAMVFHRIGLVPDLGAWYTLPRVVGLQRAKELIFSAREVGAAEALQMGLALEVLAPEALPVRAAAIARSFCGASATALSLSKQALQASLQSEFSTMLDLEAAAQSIASGSEYAAESVRRFAAKEPAQFQWPARPV